MIPTVGKGLEAASEGYDGLIVIGPFNCRPFRISEAILKPISILQGMPILTYESDGYAVALSFLRQVEVHIQQVLDRAARNRKTIQTATGGLAGLFKSALADRLEFFGPCKAQLSSASRTCRRVWGVQSRVGH